MWKQTLCLHDNIYALNEISRTQKSKKATHTQTELNNSTVDSVGITTFFFIIVYIPKRVRNSVLYSLKYLVFSFFFATKKIMKWKQNKKKRNELNPLLWKYQQQHKQPRQIGSNKSAFQLVFHFPNDTKEKGHLPLA